MNAIITEETVDECIRYMAETDHECAERKAELERSIIYARKARAREFIIAVGNNELRKATAEISIEVAEADDRYIDAVKRDASMRNTRATKDLQINVWRSLEASRRRG